MPSSLRGGTLPLPPPFLSPSLARALSLAHALSHSRTRARALSLNIFRFLSRFYVAPPIFHQSAAEVRWSPMIQPVHDLDAVDFEVVEAARESAASGNDPSEASDAHMRETNEGEAGVVGASVGSSLQSKEAAAHGERMGVEDDAAGVGDGGRKGQGMGRESHGVVGQLGVTLTVQQPIGGGGGDPTEQDDEEEEDAVRLCHCGSGG